MYDWVSQRATAHCKGIDSSFSRWQAKHKEKKLIKRNEIDGKKVCFESGNRIVEKGCSLFRSTYVCVCVCVCCRAMKYGMIYFKL